MDRVRDRVRNRVRDRDKGRVRVRDRVRLRGLAILGVTITNKLSVSEHVCTVISSCAQTMHAIRILRSHGMDDAQLQLVYRAVVIAKITYASSSWWGFTMQPTANALKVFCDVVNGKISTRPAIPH